MFGEKTNISKVVELRCKTTAYLGVGAIKKMADIAKDLKTRGADRVCIVTGRQSYKVSGAWDYVRAALDESSIRYDLYDKVGPNPTVDMIDEATKIAKDKGAKAIIGIGGGSPLDAAKSVAILAAYPENDARQLYMQQIPATKALPMVAINLTHGTGTEVNRFAVASILEKQYKPVIAYDSIYPLWSIDDPALTTKLPADQTRYVSIDALNHVTEAASTVLSSPYSILFAKETARLVAKYLPAALSDPTDLNARYHLLYASALGGMSFDNAVLHLTHALEHPLSAMKPEIPHGLGLSVLLPSVLKVTYPYAPEALAEVYAPIVPDLKGVPAEADKIAAKTEEWLFRMGVAQKMGDLGFVESDVERLKALVSETPSLSAVASLAPMPEEMRDRAIQTVYEESFRSYQQ